MPSTYTPPQIEAIPIGVLHMIDHVGALDYGHVHYLNAD